MHDLEPTIAADGPTMPTCAADDRSRHDARGCAAPAAERPRAPPTAARPTPLRAPSAAPTAASWPRRSRRAIARREPRRLRPSGRRTCRRLPPDPGTTAADVSSRRCWRRRSWRAVSRAAACSPCRAQLQAIASRDASAVAGLLVDATSRVTPAAVADAAPGVRRAGAARRPRRFGPPSVGQLRA